MELDSYFTKKETYKELNKSWPVYLRLFTNLVVNNDVQKIFSSNPTTTVSQHRRKYGFSTPHGLSWGMIFLGDHSHHYQKRCFYLFIGENIGRGSVALCGPRWRELNHIKLGPPNQKTSWWWIDFLFLALPSLIAVHRAVHGPCFRLVPCTSNICSLGLLHFLNKHLTNV